jgi:hypothetical protein
MGCAAYLVAQGIWKNTVYVCFVYCTHCNFKNSSSSLSRFQFLGSTVTKKSSSVPVFPFPVLFHLRPFLHWFKLKIICSLQIKYKHTWSSSCTSENLLGCQWQMVWVQATATTNKYGCLFNLVTYIFPFLSYKGHQPFLIFSPENQHSSMICHFPSH